MALSKECEDANNPASFFVCQPRGAPLRCMGERGEAVLSLLRCFSQLPAQNTLPNLIAQILPSWIESQSSVPLFTHSLLSFSTEVTIGQ